MNRADFLKLIAIGPLALHAMNLNQFSQIINAFPDSNLMPLLFIGHGSPMNAIEENKFVEGWRVLASKIPKPNAILCVSAHWETNGTFITAMDKPKTIHDFGGFPDELFKTQYPADGNVKLANEISDIIPGMEIKPDFTWGLDHGCWSVLKVMYPSADIPVLQLSIDYNKSLEQHTQLAHQLSILRQKGVLVLGSGNMVHNLRMLDWRNPHKGYDWAIEANEGFKTAIMQEDYKILHSIQTTSKAFSLSVPTPEHYIPLLYIMGLKNKNEDTVFYNDFTIMGSLSMTSLLIS